MKHIKDELFNVEDFVRIMSKKDQVGGFNVYVSKEPGKSYILAKCVDTLKPLYTLPVQLDWANPIERPLITNAIHRGIHGVDASSEVLEAEMVHKTEDDEYVEAIKDQMLR